MNMKMTLRYITILCYIVAFFVTSLRGVPWVYNGTTPGLQSIILGRCYEFKEFNHLNRMKDFSVDVPCVKVWEEFRKSFAYKGKIVLIIFYIFYTLFFIRNYQRLSSTRSCLIFNTFLVPKIS